MFIKKWIYRLSLMLAGGYLVLVYLSAVIGFTLKTPVQQLLLEVIAFTLFAIAIKPN